MSNKQYRIILSASVVMLVLLVGVLVYNIYNTPKRWIIMSANYVELMQEPVVPTYIKVPWVAESEVLPEPAEDNDQISRDDVWMLTADVNDEWFEYNESFGEIVNLLYNKYGFTIEQTMGIAANIYYESHWNSGQYAYDGSGSYGLCQWLGNRRNNLWAWCSNNGYDGSTIKGQVAFLVHEMDVYGIYLSGSAYDCGYQFCTKFERPNNPSYNGNIRGNYAQELYDMFMEE